jgi:hypothetical protein
LTVVDETNRNRLFTSTARPVAGGVIGAREVV